VLRISEMRVRSFDLGYLDIYWEVDPCFEDIGDYEFVVERSDNEFGPYMDLTVPVVNRFHVKDVTVKGQHSYYHKLYYRVRTIKRGSDPVESTVFPDVGGIRLAAKPDLMALEMARLNNLKLKEFMGRKVWVFPKKTAGQRCGACFDEVSQRRLRSSCGVCFDAGWVGGYHAPVETYAMIVTPNETTIHANFGDIQTEDTTLLLGNYPEIKEGDVIVEAENIRWRVASTISKVSKARAVIRQQAPIHRIPKSDIEYSLPLKMSDDEIRDLVASPERNYTNPQTIEETSLAKALNGTFTGN